MAGTSLLYILLLRATLTGVLSGASAMFAAVPVLAVQPKFRHRPRPVSRPNLRRSWRMHHLGAAGAEHRGADGDRGGPGRAGTARDPHHVRRGARALRSRLPEA